MTNQVTTGKPDLKELTFTMLKIAVPVSLQSLISVGINLIDTFMLSSMGDAQLSAASLGGQYITFFMFCCMGIGMGASVLTSRFWGMKDADSLKKAVTIMLRFCLGFCLLFTLLTLFIPGYIMRVFTPDPEIINYGKLYLKWLLPTFFCTGFSVSCTVILRSVGQIKIPLISAVSAFFINIFFNWVFIFGKFGAPRMEIAGAALGTLIARIFELLFICGFFFFFDKKIKYRIKDAVTEKCAPLVKEYIKVSIPVFISDSLLALGNSAVAIVTGHIGKTFVAANSVTAVVQQLSSVLTQGTANASGIITGHTLGRGEIKKARKQGYFFFITGIIIGAAAAVLIFFIKNPIINHYKISDEAKEIAHQLMYAILFISVFQSVNGILTKGVLRAGGDTRFLMVTDILFLWAASIPLGAFAGLVWHLPAFWIYILLKTDHIIKCILCFFRLKSGKWIKKIANGSA